MSMPVVETLLNIIIIQRLCIASTRVVTSRIG
jgi:hypothetical protein